MPASGEADVPVSEGNLGKPVLAQVPLFGQRSAVFKVLSGSYRTCERQRTGFLEATAEECCHLITEYL